MLQHAFNSTALAIGEGVSSPAGAARLTASPWRATGGVVAEATAMPGVATVCCTAAGDSR